MRLIKWLAPGHTSQSSAAMAGFILSASEWVLWIIIALLLIALLLLVGYLLWRKERTAKPEPAKPASLDEKSGGTIAVTELPQSFQGALHTMRARGEGPDFRYRLPWLLLFGTDNAGKSSLMSESSLSNSLEEQVGIEHATGITWSFFGDGIVLDVGGWCFQPGGTRTTAWRRLLRLLVTHRPQRPLDGIILALPAEDLHGPKALSPSELVERGALTQQRLRQLTETIGFQLPIYVILTKCDVLEGFTPFCNELTPEELEQIFGWSNPYSELLQFQSEWVDQAIHSMRVTVERIQSRLFAVNDHTPDREAMFLFPGSLHTMLPPLRLLLSRALRAGGEIPAPQLRGIYCTGSTDTAGPKAHREPELIPVARPASPGTHYTELRFDEEETALSWIPSAMEPWLRPGLQIGFVHDLFFRKIFPERNLGRPLEGFFVARDRLRLTLQIVTVCLTLLLGICTGVAYHRLSRDQLHLLTLLQQIENDLHTPPRYVVDPTQVDTHPGARELIDTLANYQSGKLHSPFMPASWFSQMPQEVSNTMVQSFSRLVLARFYEALVARTRYLADTSRMPLDSSQMPLLSPGMPPSTELERSPKYLQLHAFLMRVHDLDEHISLYNHVCRPGDNSPLESIVELDEYLHNRTDPVHISNESKSFFQKAINDSAYKCFEYSADLRNMMTAKNQKLIESLDTAWITNNPVRGATDSLVADFNELNQPVVSLNDVERISEDLRKAQTLYAAPELHWTGADEMSIPDNLAGVTSGVVASSPFFEPWLGGWVTATAETDLSLLQTALQQAETPLTGLVTDNNSGQLALSAGSLEVQTALNALSKSAFFINTAEPITGILESSPAEIAWDKSALDAAATLPASYGKFVTSQLSADRAPVQVAISRVAAEAVSASVKNAIYAAVHPSPNPGSPIAEAQSFNEAAPSITALLGTLSQYHLTAPRDLLRSLSMRQASAILVKLNILLNFQRPYNVPAGAFSNWTDGEPGMGVLDVATADGLASYVAVQHQEIADLNIAAQPVVQFLQANRGWAPESSLRVLSRWQGIDAALEASAAKRPGNSVQRLEDFLLTSFNKVQPSTGCVSPQSNPGAGSDYFSLANAELKRSLVLRCQELLAGGFDTAYLRLAQAFNRTLSQRFPFAPLSAPTMSEADPSAIAQVFRLHDTAADMLQSPQAATSPAPVQAFLINLNSTRPWFTSLLGGITAGSNVTLDLAPEFRAERSLEIGGNQVIDWHLQVGKDSLHASDPPGKLHWNLGDPVILTLRWAKDSAFLPARSNSYGSNEGGYRTEGDTVSWRWTDSWSLLRFLQQFQRNDPSAKSTPLLPGQQSFLLQFDVPEVAASATAVRLQTSTTSNARVFLRLLISAPGSASSLPNPRFPQFAPPLPIHSTRTAQEDQ